MFRPLTATILAATLTTVAATAQEARKASDPKGIVPTADVVTAPTIDRARPAPASADVPYLELTAKPDLLTAFVHHPESEYLGAVLLAETSDLMHFLVDLPPILANAAVMGVGTAKDGELRFQVAHKPWPDDFQLWGQALVLTATGLSASGLVHVGAL